MPIEVRRASVVVGHGSLPYREFPGLLQAHLDVVADTDVLERSGHRLLSTGFPEVELVEFIRAVCRWGGWAGIAGRVRRDNTTDQIRAAFTRAGQELGRRSPDLALAMGAINRIKGLGKPSYASKQLRFLCPERCPILDNMFAKDLGYTYDVDGYAELADDLAMLARALEANAIPNPRDRPNGRWFAGDVDMALFAWVRRERGEW